jgi:trans-2,3-dihydro-3-hydroxyanthranilate isomerase
VEYWLVSVFMESEGSPLRTGNPLAVCPDPGELAAGDMQAVAQTFNLSETTFVTDVRSESYDVRIFTPRRELPFAGHPTLGTAWLLRRLGLIAGDVVEQRSQAGATPVRAEGDALWLRRTGLPGDDVEDRRPRAAEGLARTLGLEAGAVGLEARELGRAGRLRPAIADAGVPVLLVPLQDVDALGRVRPAADAGLDLGTDGIYCFTAVQAGRIRARGFFPDVGVSEDPATGSAAAALGLYLAARLGAIDVEIAQGVEIGRACRILVRARPDEVEVGGSCDLIARGRLESQ